MLARWTTVGVRTAAHCFNRVLSRMSLGDDLLGRWAISFNTSKTVTSSKEIMSTPICCLSAKTEKLSLQRRQKYKLCWLCGWKRAEPRAHRCTVFVISVSQLRDVVHLLDRTPQIFWVTSCYPDFYFWVMRCGTRRFCPACFFRLNELISDQCLDGWMTSQKEKSLEYEQASKKLLSSLAQLTRDQDFYLGLDFRDGYLSRDDDGLIEQWAIGSRFFIYLTGRCSSGNNQGKRTTWSVAIVGVTHLLWAFAVRLS